MKKIFILFILLFFVTGCSGKVIFDFTEENIKSNVEIVFNQEEFKNYINEGSVHSEGRFDTKESTEEFIVEKYKELSFIALKIGDKYEYFQNEKYEILDNQYKYSFKYDYNYDNFKDNSLMKDCFEYFFVEEDENFYHYNIKGSYTCSEAKNIKLIVKSENKNIRSNSTNIKDDQHSWNIEEDNNNIVFTVSKENKEENNKSRGIGTMQIVGIILIIILAGLSVLFAKLTKKND